MNESPWRTCIQEEAPRLHVIDRNDQHTKEFLCFEKCDLALKITSVAGDAVRLKLDERNCTCTGGKATCILKVRSNALSSLLFTFPSPPVQIFRQPEAA